MRRAHLLHRTPARWFDLRIPEDCTAWELEGFVARLELRTFRWRMQLAADELLRQGRSRNGREPFGYRWNKLVKEWEAHPERFPLVVGWCRDIGALSARRIAARDGVDADTVLNTLHNPAICGWPARRWGPHHGARPWRVPDELLPRERWEWPEQEGRYPKACTRAEWEAIQALLLDRRLTRTKTGTSENGWCRDVVAFVGSPGRVRLASAWVRGEGFHTPTYERRPPGGGKLYVARALVHEAAAAALAALCREPALLGAALAQARAQERRAAEAALPFPGRAGLAAALGRARGALDTATRLLVEAVDAEERASLARVRAEKLAAVREVRAQLSPAPTPSAPVSSAAPSVEYLAAMGGQFEPVWAELSGEERRALVNAVVAAVPVEIVPGHARRGHERRLRPLVWQPWLAPFVGPLG